VFFYACEIGCVGIGCMAKVAASREEHVTRLCVQVACHCRRPAAAPVLLSMKCQGTPKKQGSETLGPFPYLRVVALHPQHKWTLSTIQVTVHLQDGYRVAIACWGCKRLNLDKA
jgi:hypothetical protein